MIIIILKTLLFNFYKGFLGGSRLKNSPANAEDPRDMGSIPGPGRPPGGGHGSALQYASLENLMDRGAIAGRL